MKKTLYLTHPEARRQALSQLCLAPDGYKVTIEPPKRSLDQNALLHALCSEASRNLKFMGKTLEPYQWKVLFVSGHSIATKQPVEMVPGLEGEFVNIRESTANMSKARLSSLVDYIHAYMSNEGKQ